MPPTPPRLRALVTGASGFVGTHLVRRLAADDWTVRAATRRPWADAPAGIEQVVVGELGPDTEWMSALEGVDVAFHLAGRAHVLSETAADPAAEYERVNVEGTVQLARNAARAGVRRLVYVSTIGVHGDHTEGAALDESSPIAPGSAYAWSKSRAEHALRAESGHGLEFTILRPPLIYGPGVPGNFRRLLRLVASGIPLPLARVRNRRSLVAVANVVHALACCGEKAEAGGEAFVVADGDDLSTPELVRTLAQGLGVPARLVPVPLAIAQLAASLTGFGNPFRQLCASLQVNAEKLHSQLGWVAPVTATVALHETAQWHARTGGK